jgi:hypothetical protein
LVPFRLKIHTSSQPPRALRSTAANRAASKSPNAAGYANFAGIPAYVAPCARNINPRCRNECNRRIGSRIVGRQSSFVRRHWTRKRNAHGHETILSDAVASTQCADHSGGAALRKIHIELKNRRHYLCDQQPTTLALDFPLRARLSAQA